ncbi:hypothetical protein C4D60_Mb09t26480 [Musa balbisiana]|uniref:Wound-responsive family protein n=1 Tax=Musa balbisiana TaxID=52838 RepID=A0A4S8IK12_MUSBA|nr:hypothetical protein C4D60_Mb09t26480 [Musa balbisiana]
MDCRVLLPSPRRTLTSVTRIQTQSRRLIHMVSASKASLIIAASMAAVEALKDQAGLCRWNYTVESLHQRAKRSMATLSQAKRMSCSSVDQWRKAGEGAVERAKRTEMSLSKIIYWDCWGPK